METRVLDKNAEWLGVSTEQLMENAGKAVANEARKLPYKKWLVLCGSGNNGGDGYVAARYLKDCIVMAVSPPKTKLAKKNFRRAKAIGLPVYKYSREKFEWALKECDAIIDAMLGVGIKGELKEPYRSVVERLNESGKFILAVDVPTGFGGKIAAKANLTVTFHFIKEGMDEKCGEIVLADIGIPKEAEEFVGIGDLIYYPKPRKDSHKGDNGIVAIIGGGPYTGAPALAGLAALRTGCDLSYICCPYPAWQVIASFSPNLIVRKMHNEVFTPADIREIEDVVEKADAILIGPGLGAREITKDACRDLVKKYVEEKLFVVDADAIGALRGIDGNGNIIFTPHAGEFKKLTGVELPNEIEKRKEIVKKEAEKRNATILLKGAIDIISDGEKVKMNRIHNEAMTVGGTGDVLAGITAALLSKKVKPFHAACMAAFINGMAGNMAFEEKSYGMLASDIIEKIPKVIKEYVE